jgi:hypothetical protein
MQGPFTLNTLALLQFLTYAIIIVPINFSWQKYLEARWPGFPGRSRPVAATAAEAKGGAGAVVVTVDPGDLFPVKEKEKHDPHRASGARWRSRSGLGNFLMKFFLDQTVGSVMNILLFIVLINVLKGVGWRRIGELVLEVRPFSSQFVSCRG